MRERMCKHQETMLETTLNIHVSRCRNREAQNFCGPVHKDLCQGCDGLTEDPIDGMVDSLADYVYPEKGGRSPELIDALMEDHCKKCESYSAQSGCCALESPTRWFTIRDVMENETLHCVKGEW